MLPIIEIPPRWIVNEAKLAFMMKPGLWDAAYDVFAAYYSIPPVKVLEDHDWKKVRLGAYACYVESEATVYSLPGGMTSRTAWHEFAHHLSAKVMKTMNIEVLDERKSEHLEFVHEAAERSQDYEEAFCDTFAAEVVESWW